MKSCLGLLVALLVFTVVIGGGALIWYLSNTAEFSRNAATSAMPPKATPTRPQPGKPGQPPVAIPAREPARR